VEKKSLPAATVFGCLRSLRFPLHIECHKAKMYRFASQRPATFLRRGAGLFCKFTDKTLENPLISDSIYGISLHSENVGSFILKVRYLPAFSRRQNADFCASMSK
jgi:hypothetical protein